MRELVLLPKFKLSLSKLLNKRPDLEEKLASILDTVCREIRHPSLKTHRLHGSLSKYYACRVNYDYRLIFNYDKNFIYLYSIGTHDEVY